MARPTSFFYESPKGCSSKNCAQEVLAIGTPILWWIGTIAIAIAFGFFFRARATKRFDSSLTIIVLGISAGYLPWFFLQKRTVFTFYAIIIEPFLILAILYCAHLYMKASSNTKVARIVIAFFTLSIFICFIYFLPLFTGQVITYDAWHDKMWLPSWI